MKTNIIRTALCLAAILLACTSRLMGLSIGVPSVVDQIKAAEVIVIGHFVDETCQVFVVEEVLKSPVKQGKEVKVVNPYPTVFSMESVPNLIIKSPLNLNAPQCTVSVQSPKPEQTIFVGHWNKEEQAIMPTYIHASFWPQAEAWRAIYSKGVNRSADYTLPSLKIPELRKFILKTLKKQKQEAQEQ